MKLSQVAQLLFVVVASIGVYSFVRAAQLDRRASGCQAMCELRPSYAGRNRKVPDFELPDKDGKMVRFSSFLGTKPVVLNFWTKTCQPCLEEMPKLAELATMVGKDGIKVVTICTDESFAEVRETLKVLLGTDEPPFEILFDPETTVVADKFGTTMYPETWIVDGSGIIRARIDGDPGRYGMSWTSAMVLEVLENLSRPLSCPVEFAKGKAVGRYASLCGDRI